MIVALTDRLLVVVEAVEALGDRPLAGGLLYSQEVEAVEAVEAVVGSTLRCRAVWCCVHARLGAAGRLGHLRIYIWRLCRRDAASPHY